jgi:hypothetical protein
MAPEEASPKSKSTAYLHFTLYTLHFTLLLSILPSPALAIQEHGAGLHTHQMAHVFFAFSLGLLIYWLRRRGLVASKGWRYIQYAALLLIIWNVHAFWGHWLEESSGWIETRRSGAMSITISAVQGYEWAIPFYYAAKLDHLICVPSLLFLMLGLRRLLNEPVEPGEN